jgi:CheY-like chemotaxis protein
VKISNVLVVDDVALMCDFLFGVANNTLGCRAKKALDGNAAANILENENIDMLITDIEMKGLNGIELLYKVRCGAFSGTAHNIPIIIFSGHRSKVTIDECIALDVDDFLVKPITALILKTKIKHHLEQPRNICDTEYYITKKPESLKLKHANKSYPHRVKIPISLDSELLNEKPLLHNIDANTKNKLNFLLWPQGATTGYIQLDRRLQTFAINFSIFHYLFTGDAKPIAIESGLQKACESSSYLFYIADNIQLADSNREYLLFFKKNLELLKPITDELSSINIKHHSRVSTLLKNLLSWWLKTCNKPIMQKEHDGEPRN